MLPWARMVDPNLHLGTIRWAKEDWAGTFYPDDLPPDGHLAHYAKSFDTVEADVTFYRTPSPAMCRRWREQTPDGFRFALKVMRKVTHEKVLAGCEGDMEWFLAAAAELGDKVAFGVLQFGPSGKKSVCSDAGAFTKRLGEFAKLCPERHRWVVEVRTPKWIGDELLGFLRERKFILALAETDRMPKPAELREKWGEKLLTGDAAYARIFGERKRIEGMTKRFDRIIIDRTAETKAWIRLPRDLRADVDRLIEELLRQAAIFAILPPSPRTNPADGTRGAARRRQACWEMPKRRA